MARKTIVAGNWKLYGTAPETRRLIMALKHKLVGFSTRAQVVVCPPFPSLETAVDAARGSAVNIGAQNVFWEAGGASTEMLEAIGVDHVIIGHSERRHVFGETDADVAKKLRRVLTGVLVPIVCVGEVLSEREAGRTSEVVTRQVTAALEGVGPEHAARIVVAYEPVWAIGTGRTATPEMANDVHVLIRERIAGMLGHTSASAVRILYGGSVKPENAADLMSRSDVDGVLVGGASLDAGSFAEIVRSAP
jgi:triosephosphate isomerase